MCSLFASHESDMDAISDQYVPSMRGKEIMESRTAIDELRRSIEGFFWSCLSLPSLCRALRQSTS